MKLLMAMVLLLSANFSFASGVWDITEHTVEDLRTTEEITNALITYPQILEKWDGEASEIKYINLTVINFEWTGETQCEENDPRLTLQAVNFAVCPTEEISMQCIFELDPVLTPWGDPCKQ